MKEQFKYLPPLELDRNTLAFVGEDLDVVVITAGHLSPRRARVLIAYLTKILPDHTEADLCVWTRVGDHKLKAGCTGCTFHIRTDLVNLGNCPDCGKPLSVHPTEQTGAK